MSGAEPSESYVQVAADGSGKKIRNIAAEVVQEDGSTATVYMQVVSLKDEFGNSIAIGNPMAVSDQGANEKLSKILEILEEFVLKVS